VKYIEIEGSENSPKVILNFKEGKIEITGESYPENTFDFYQPILAWLYDYFNAPQKITTVDLNLLYFNSSTVQVLFEIFDIFQEKREETKLIINWHYDKDDIDWQDDFHYFAEEFEMLKFNAVGESRT